MSTPNWAAVGDGHTFESLVAAIVVRRDPTARPFGRPGPDGGIDVLSGDGRTVYQAKFRGRWGPKVLESVTLDELSTILTYREPSHRHHALWADVERWVLVTNGQRGAAETARWKTTIAPAFAAEGMTAEWWSASELGAWLQSEMPGVRRAFFEGECRIFESLREAEARVRPADGFDGRTLDARPVGRAAVFDALDRWLSDERAPGLCCMHGPGGVGKTAILWHFGWRVLARSNPGRDVWWADDLELAHNARWFDHIVPERPALILLDEPADVRAVQRLQRQMAGRANWRVLLTVRSLDDPIVAALEDARTPFEPFALAPLAGDETRAAAVALAKAVGLSQFDDVAAHRIARISEGLPGWMAMALRLVGDGRPIADLPTEPQGLAGVYVRRWVEQSADRARASDLLRQVALWQPIDIEDASLLAFIGRQIGDDDPALAVADDLARWVEQHIVWRRGDLHAIKPDLIQDHILAEWLVDVHRPAHGFRSQQADQLVRILLGRVAGPTPPLRHALRNLARVEVVARRRTAPIDVRLLDGVVDQMLALADAHRSAPDRLLVIGLAETLAPARPGAIARLSAIFRSTPSAPKTVQGPLGERVFNHDAVLDKLPSLITSATEHALDSSARRALLEEMMALAELEAGMSSRALRHLWFGGRRPSEMLPRMAGYAARAEALQVTRERLSTLSSPPARKIVGQLLKPLLAAEWESSHLVGDTFYITSGVRPAGHAFWDDRAALREALWCMAEHDSSDDNRLFALTHLHESHRALADARRHASTMSERFDAEWLADLKRALTLVRSSAASPKVKIAVRSLWQWHARVDHEPERKMLAKQCEEALWQDPKLAEYAEVCRDDYRARAAGQTATATRLAGQPVECIVEWFDNAFEIWEDGLSVVLVTAYHLGAAWQADTVRSAARTLAAAKTPGRWLLAARMLRHCVERLRAEGDEQQWTAAWDTVLDAAVNDNVRRAIIADVYLVPPSPPLSVELDAAENWLDWLWPNPLPDVSFFRVLGRLAEHAPDHFGRVADRAWSRAAVLDQGRAFGLLVDSMLPTCSDAMPYAVSEWLAEHLMQVPDIDRFGFEYPLDALLEPCRATRSLSWLVQRLNWRATSLSASESPADPELMDRVAVLPAEADLGFFLRPLSAEDQVAASGLLDFVDKFARVDATVALYAPALCRRLDPEGSWLPSLVDERLTQADIESPTFLIHAGLARGWPEGSPPWRSIALAACRRVQGRSNARREQVWASLWDGSTGVLKGRTAFADHAASQAEFARRSAAQETEPALLDYWRYRESGAVAEHVAEHKRLEEEPWKQ